MLEGTGRHPDLVLLWVTPGHAGALEDIGAAVRAVLAPTVLLGVVAGGVVAGAEDSGAGPGVALLAARVGPVTPHLAGDRLPAGPVAAALVVADAGGSLPGGLAATTVGGRTSGGGVLVQDRVHRRSAAAALLGPAADLRVVAADAARPVGAAHVAGRSAGTLLAELDGRPALEVVQEELADHLAGTDLRLARSGLRLVVGGGPISAEVLGTERASGALALGTAVPDGATVHLAVLDPAAAAPALAARLRDAGPATAAVAWCGGSGPAWWGAAPGPGRAAAEVLGGVPVAGCATTAEVAGGAGATTSATVVALLGRG